MGAGWSHPLESIGWRKRRDLGIAAGGWIERHGRAGEEYRFDAVHVIAKAGAGGRGRDAAGDGEGLSAACHVENAWSM